MWLVVGLGNPGTEYAKNRHNVGFMLVDRLVERWKAPALKDKFSGRFTRGSIGGEEFVLLTPLTYMNLSGESVRKAMDFFKIPVGNVLVAHDEMDLAFREVRDCVEAVCSRPVATTASSPSSSTPPPTSPGCASGWGGPRAAARRTGSSATSMFRKAPSCPMCYTPRPLRQRPSSRKARPLPRTT